jgi:outer membrane lipase/esterase
MAGLHQQTGANIIVLNEEQLLNTVIANPARYGFSNVTNACTSTAACAFGTTATQNTYLFWDQVHPTTHAQDIIAQYAAASLLGFEALTVPARLGATGAQDFTDLLDARLNALRAGAGGFSYNINGATGANGDPDRKLGVFVSGGGGFGYRNNSSNTGGTDLGFTYTNAATALGVDYRFNPDFSAGLALGYGDDHATVNYGGKVQNKVLNAGLYAIGTSGNTYVKFSASYGTNWYETNRPGAGYGNITGKPTGYSYMAAIESGYSFAPWHGLGLTPELGVSFTNVSLQSYTESGDPLLTQQVAAQTYQEVLGTAGFTAATSWQIGGMWLHPYASAAAQIHLAGDDTSFASAFTDEPVVTLTNSYPVQPTAWALFGVGASASLTNSLSASVNLDATAFRTTGNDLLVSGAASWRF